MPVLILLMVLLLWPAIAVADGYKEVRGSPVAKRWIDAEGTPDCALDPDLKSWSIDFAGQPGDWFRCPSASDPGGQDLIDPSTERLLGTLAPDPEEFSGVAPVGACRGPNHVFVNTSLTGPKYMAGFCQAQGDTPKTEPYVAKFDQILDSLGAARTCLNGADCGLLFPAGNGILIAIGGTSPVFTVTPNLFLTGQARGDLIRRGATAWERLPLGPNRSTLTSDGTDVVAGGPKAAVFNFQCINTTTAGTFYLRAGSWNNSCQVGDSNSNGLGGGGMSAGQRHKVTRTGTITRLFCESDFFPGAGVTNTYTVRVNGINTALTCAITGGAAFTCSATGGTVAITQGSMISVEVVTSATTAAHDHQCAVEEEWP